MQLTGVGEMEMQSSAGASGGTEQPAPDRRERSQNVVSIDTKHFIHSISSCHPVINFSGINTGSMSQYSWIFFSWFPAILQASTLLSSLSLVTQFVKTDFLYNNCYSNNFYQLRLLNFSYRTL